MASSTILSAPISSPGIGSSLDVNTIISQLMAVESQPLTALAKQEASYDTKLTAYGQLSSAFASFQSTMNTASDPATWQAMLASVSDPTVLSATAGTGATTGTHTISVGSTLAQAQTLATSVGQSDVTNVIGTGTLTFYFGTTSGTTFTPSANSSAQTVTITSANDTLSGIRDAINSANIGVTASIVNDGTTNGNRLVLTSKNTGTQNTMKVVATDANGNALTTNTGLGELAYDPAATMNMTQTLAAQDLSLTVDGIAMTKSSNTVTDAIQGVTLNVNKANATTTLSLTNNTVAVGSAVQSFVSSYNTLMTQLRQDTAYDSTTQSGGPLLGDATANNMKFTLRGILNSAIAGLGGTYQTLNDIGVSFQKDGTLTVDSNKLNTAMSTHFSAIEGLFANLGSTTDSQIQYIAGGSATQGGVYGVQVNSLATQGQVTGTQLLSSTQTVTQGSNDTLSVTVDGQSGTITLPAGASYATPADLATQLQTQINGLSSLQAKGISVTVTAKATGTNDASGNPQYQLVLSSASYGKASNVQISGNAATAFFGGALSGTGTDVQGTINGQTATGSGQFLSAASSNANSPNPAAGLQIKVLGGATGNRGTVSYSMGFASQLASYSTSVLSSTGLIQSAEDGLNANIKNVDNQRTALQDRLTTIQTNLRLQYTQLDATLGALTQTSNFLTQQLSAMSSSKSGG